ncbi:MAG: hypothetical protein ACR2QM_10895, partial [Longimicrobiales bacterium]
VREGPEWRILLKTRDGSGTITARTEGVSAPTTLGDLRQALERPEARTFLDESGARWRAELIPNYEGGQADGELLMLSAERRSDRLKIRYASLASLSVLTDVQLRKSLEAARRAGVS